ncbi:MAG: long-chain-fatty-acid--CoA ligase [Desulfobacterales bacterium]
MDIGATLVKAMDLYPDKTAVVDGERSFTYLQIGEHAAALARFLVAHGLQSGDRIAILEVNSHMFLESYYAAAGMGAILSPLNFRLSSKEIAFILNDSGARWLLAGAQFSSLVKDTLAQETPLEGILWLGEAPAGPTDLASQDYDTVIKTHAGSFSPVSMPEDQVAHLYYTSGTTGKPKGVMLTHKNVVLHALATIAELKLVDSDIWGHIAPMFHLADAWATFAVTWVGGRHVMVGQFEAQAVMAAIEKECITLSNLIPTMLNLIIKHPQVEKYDFSSLRAILSGGAPIAPELVRKIIDVLGCDYIQTYGMTETSPYLTLSILKEHLHQRPPEEQFKYRAKTGRPLMTVELKVVDENGEPVRPDEQQVGEIWVRGDTITPGYWNRPEATAEAFYQGWLRTGDLAVVDSEGYVNIVDRKKDMILSGGENIYSTEVENVLYMHPKILEAAAFGVPDEKWGEAVKAAVVLKPDESASEEEIIRFCKQHIASFKAPKSIDFIAEIPKTGSGKLFKKALRDPYWSKAKNK